jgi:hypothetical protein
MNGTLFNNGTVQAESLTSLNLPLNSLAPINIRTKLQPSFTGVFLFRRWNKSPDVLM